MQPRLALLDFTVSLACKLLETVSEVAVSVLRLRQTCGATRFQGWGGGEEGKGGGVIACGRADPVQSVQSPASTAAGNLQLCSGSGVLRQHGV